MRTYRRLSCIYLALGLAAVSASAAGFPLLHPLFSDHAVLQRGEAVPVWGWAAPGAEITVAFAGREAVAVAGPDGKWMARLAPMEASAESRELTVRSSAGEAVTVRDVLVGDVWLCSGQSNMEMGVGACEVDEDIAAADFPRMRLLTVPRLVATAPVQVVDVRWLPCSPETVMDGLWGGFSAAGFFFGRALHQELDVPIGLIHSSWGGTVAEAWTSQQGLTPLGDFDEAMAQLDVLHRGGEEDPEAFVARYDAWCLEQDPGSREGWQAVSVGDDNWRIVQAPQPFEQAGLPDYDGMVWFRRTFEPPAAWAGRDLQLDLGPIDDFDTVWVNGVQVGQTYNWMPPRSYRVPASAVKAGTNAIAIRVLDTAGAGGLTGRADQYRIAPADSAAAESIALSGPWHMRASAVLAEMTAPPRPVNRNDPNVTTVLYNGMIAPLVPYALKGAIWYQGESNAERAAQYRRLLPAMIRDWRARFGVGDFPFYIVQLAAFQPTHPEPRDHAWAELREAQAETARTVPNCGLAVAIDVGDAADIHPKDKKSVGERLALSALAGAYGKDVVGAGPWYRSMRITPEGIRLQFDAVGGGLTAHGGKLTGFAIAGADRRFVWADAVIDGDEVVVSSPTVPSPVAVRYAWDINPECNLYNAAGLPAVPFRTDDWPLTTEGSL